jgi:hypothetical protein
MVDAARSEPGLGSGEAASLFAHHVADRNPGGVEADLGVPVLVVVAEHRIVPDDGDARGIPRDEYHRLLPVRRGGRVGLAHDDQHGAARVHRTAGPPLAPGDDVLIAVPLDPAGDVGRVAACHVRLGHGEGRADAPGQQRLEPGMFLLVGAQQVQQLHVACIGCLTVDRLRSQVVAPARQLRDRRVL